MPKEEPTPAAPSWYEAAMELYADAFDVSTPKELSEASEDFAELTQGERDYTIAHLLYLNLRGQRAQLRLTAELRNGLEEIADIAEGADGGEEEGDDDAPPPAPERRAPADRAQGRGGGAAGGSKGGGKGEERKPRQPRAKAEQAPVEVHVPDVLLPGEREQADRDQREGEGGGS